MFTGTDVHVSDIASLYRGSCCAIAVLSFLVYDCILSFPEELSLIWLSESRRTIASFVYFFIRYIPILDGLICVTTIYPLPLLSCQTITWIHRFLPAVQELAASTFATLRIYAVSDRKRWVAAIAFLLLLVPPSMALICDISLVDIKYLPDPLDCIMIVQSNDLFVRLSMISRGCSIAADLLVAGVTWLNAYKEHKFQKGLKLQNSMRDVILYDGSLYFVILAMLNVMQIIFLRLRLRDPFVITSDVTLFTTPIASILVSHFLLDLRRLKHAPHAQTHPSFINSNIAHLSMPMPTLADWNDTRPSFVASFSGPVYPAPFDFVDPEDEQDANDALQTRAEYASHADMCNTSVVGDSSSSNTLQEKGESIPGGQCHSDYDGITTATNVSCSSSELRCSLISVEASTRISTEVYICGADVID